MKLIIHSQTSTVVQPLKFGKSKSKSKSKKILFIVGIL